MSSNEQTLKIKIEADSSKATEEIQKNTKAVKDLKDTTSTAAASMSKSFDNISESVKSSGDKLCDSVKEQIGNLKKLQKQSGTTEEATSFSFKKLSASILKSIISFASLKAAARAAWRGIKAVWQWMSDIGDKAAEFGTTPEVFQKLRNAAKECGASMDDVSSAFKSINQTAKQALQGDTRAADALRRVGIEAENLRGLAPEQVFQQVATALTYMGDSAAEQEATVAVCGDSVERLSGSLLSLADVGGMSMDAIIGNEEIQAVKDLQAAFDSLKDSIIALLANSGLAKILEKFAHQLKECIEEIKALDNIGTLQASQEWNNVNVSKENNEKYKARFDEALKKAIANSNIRGQVPYSELQPYMGYANKIQYDLRATPENPYGFKPKGTPSILTQKEIADSLEKSQKDKDARELAELRRLFGSGDDDMKAKIAEYEAAMQKRIEKTRELTLASAVPGKFVKATIDHDYASEIREMSRSKKTAADQSALGSQLEELRKTPLQKQEEKDKKVIEEMRAQAAGNEELLKKVSEYEQELKKAREERYAEKPPSVAASQTQRGWRSPVRNLSRLHLEEQRKTTRAIKDADQAARKAAQKPEGEKDRKVIRVTGSHEIGGNDPDYTNKEKRYLELRNLGLLDQARMTPGRFQTQEKILSAIARKLDAMRSGVYVVKGGGSSK